MNKITQKLMLFDDMFAFLWCFV